VCVCAVARVLFACTCVHVRGVLPSGHTSHTSCITHHTSHITHHTHHTRHTHHTPPHNLFTHPRKRSLKFFLSLYGHKLPAISLDISSDSTLLVSGSADKNIKVCVCVCAAACVHAHASVPWCLVQRLLAHTPLFTHSSEVVPVVCKQPCLTQQPHACKPPNHARRCGALTLATVTRASLHTRTPSRPCASCATHTTPSGEQGADGLRI
jgi:hypothetical protein